MSTLNNLDDFFTDICNAIRSKKRATVDFTDMTTFNQTCNDKCGLTVNQSVFNAMNDTFSNSDKYPDFMIFGLSYGANREKDIIMVRIHNSSEYWGQRFDKSLVAVTIAANGFIITNNTGKTLDVGQSYCMMGTVIDTYNTMRSMNDATLRNGESKAYTYGGTLLTDPWFDNTVSGGNTDPIDAADIPNDIRGL